MGEIAPRNTPDPQKIHDAPIVEVGQWYWVAPDESDERQEWFSCVVEIGSNYVELHGVPHGNSYSTARIHLDEFSKRCRLEADPESVIRGQVEFFRNVVREKITQVKEITARLGISGSPKIEQQPAEEACKALSTVSGTKDAKKYKKDLIRAKEEDLPKLFKEIQEANENLASWMSAQVLPIKAMAEGMKSVVEEIEGRIFNVTLYAGLTEEVVQFRKGAPAAFGEKLRIMQRLLYMDEECLLDYKHGGMSFGKIKDFDKWLAKPANRDRILPFPRTLVAFRVRRGTKEREALSIAEIMINLQEEELDKATFLYIRNGESLYRLNCDLEFGELIFPGRHESDLNEPMMARMFGTTVNEIITRREYDQILRDHEEKRLKAKAWAKEHPKESHICNPYQEWFTDNYEPFDPSSVYYDEIKDVITKRVIHYNRIALIVQGLFDRSEIFHPHPQVKLWNPEGFASAVELVYDGAGILHYGDPPDFEEYRKALNALLKEGSITIGQDDFWQEKEAEKESARMDNDWRVKTEYRPKRFQPYGNPGPGYLAQVVGLSKNKATFKWNRKRLVDTWGQRRGDPISCSIAVPEARLLNVSAYVPGDFKRFFEDPRTRAKYLKWAPTLLAAEEYHAGNIKPGPDEE